MVQDLGLLKESASQTAGPYVHIGLTPNFSDIRGVYETDLGSGPLYNDGAKGERITITGRVFDGAGMPLRDALLEIWQADADGLYNSPSEHRGKADPNFAGWGRCPTNMDDGTFIFETIKPGKVPFIDGRPMAPHVTFWIVARGINIGLHTRMYFSDEEAANGADPILTRIEHKVRVPTLIGIRNGDIVTFNIHLQGERETIFFDS
ncbi:protocatechuate 3,4-dioxygenase subunit alpha [Rhizobiaceae bacterium n13]|uniref:Protocatechuate 3,4-dioxygenase subunit alpha n=1 Tax=Ferirhizobium litorale TaxID=2927786 RepID=A0AAE3U500_9HYPH|nr:protocatechuate 3,4-dioxygenase subunit alpha [Fererhizobium litorale]MDI7862882.1 protocatechuate 3,4-dioxygenase subunit alpha [Fererhizobium litorale]MDI7923968.1 protocatechuate 3,4-dioxygenase subunit alpha [Fererhizobium litorale]